jgi:hypothetical protein
MSYHAIGRLKFRNYKPLSITKDMLFHTHNYEGASVIYQVGYVPPTNQETFIELNGYPVEPYIEFEGEIIAEGQEMIGWFDVGEHSDELSDITLRQINTIIQNYDGWILLDVEVFDAIEDETLEEILPITIEGKVVISYPPDEFDDDDGDEGPEIDSAGFTYEDNFQTFEDEKINPDDLWNP